MPTVSELPSPLTLLPRAQAGDEQAMNHLLNHITPYVAPWPSKRLSESPSLLIS
ncbi:hypothetical protein [Acidovorax sp. BLS4]|uniref:hypothetical protein n=1 Tax=Acidovorax sp. BLS4 TaxID=3273430 RepID=UPI0029432D92|nr:hypothetical protein [Paracidovorax avenae]WOI45612.1 hypothetical protein R1Z03_24750 [Paracidovorax avenae]